MRIGRLLAEQLMAQGTVRGVNRRAVAEAPAPPGRPPSAAHAPGLRQTLVLPGWLPASLNPLLRAHWRARYRAGKEAALRVAMALAVRPLAPAAGPRLLRVRFSWPAAETGPDGDNCLKVLLDGLVANGLLTDDGRGGLPRFAVECGVGERRTEVELEDC